MTGAATGTTKPIAVDFDPTTRVALGWLLNVAAQSEPVIAVHRMRSRYARCGEQRHPARTAS